MALKIRLRQQGRKNRIVYRLVLSDVRSPRDGKYLETLGWYNPYESQLERSLHVDAARIQYWLGHGAILTENAERLVKKMAPEVVAQKHQQMIKGREKARQKRKAARQKKKAAVV